MDLPDDVDALSNVESDASFEACDEEGQEGSSSTNVKAKTAAQVRPPTKRRRTRPTFTAVPCGRGKALLDLFSGKGGLSRAARAQGWKVTEMDILTKSSS
jgi:hypothetical protein